jgi:hypothetical protein
MRLARICKSLIGNKLFRLRKAIFVNLVRISFKRPIFFLEEGSCQFVKDWLRMWLFCLYRCLYTGGVLPKIFQIPWIEVLADDIVFISYDYVNVYIDFREFYDSLLFIILNLSLTFFLPSSLKNATSILPNFSWSFILA